MSPRMRGRQSFYTYCVQIFSYRTPSVQPALSIWISHFVLTVKAASGSAYGCDVNLVPNNASADGAIYRCQIFCQIATLDDDEISKIFIVIFQKYLTLASIPSCEISMTLSTISLMLST